MNESYLVEWTGLLKQHSITVSNKDEALILADKLERLGFAYKVTDLSTGNTLVEWED